VIDNLMAFTGGEGDSYYQAQGDFAQSCKMFAEMWGVIVILIVHNKKTHQRDD
jgi:RecA-family ATPase